MQEVSTLDFGSAVKKRMEALGMNVSELANKMGYTPRYIYDLLSGQARWNETTIKKACEVLGMTLEFKPLMPTGTEA